VADSGIEKGAIGAAIPFSVFQPYIFARGKKGARRRKSKRARELALFAGHSSVIPLKKGTPASARSKPTYS
jgi:hypothetical protein